MSEYICECGKECANEYTYNKHRDSRVHVKAMAEKGFVMEEDAEGEVYQLPDDLAAPVNMVDENPLVRAKMVRAAFSERGWPNKEHSSSVLDFMKEHNIPVITVPRNMTHGEGNIYVQNRIKEIVNG